MKLAQLLNESDFRVLQHRAAPEDWASVDVFNIATDSRACGPNTFFIATRGAAASSQDGHRFIHEALSRGACAIAVEDESAITSDINVPVIVCLDARKFVAKYSERLHGYPSHRLKISGVTGTNGKTSTTFFLSSLLKTAGHRSAVLGTLGIGDVDALQYTGFTTPQAEILSPALAQLEQGGFTHVAMEVSSHALALSRCDGIHFSAAAFLNISPDHLDFHKDMATYREAKERLFLELLPSSSTAVIPNDDPLHQKLKDLGKNILSFGFSESADVQIAEAVTLRSGTQVQARLNGDVANLELPLFGDYNLQNVMCAAGLAMAQHLSTHAIFEGLQKVKAPPGRLQKIETTRQSQLPLVFVDFAHTPDALSKVLSTARGFSKRSLKLVFGCGGDRDKQKRPLMGKIAALLADEIWITNDNPRHENPQNIINDICDGIEAPLRRKFKIVHDRETAIKDAVKSAELDDIVVIAGKGHETTQQFGDEYMPFSDENVSKEALEDWRK